MSNRAGEPTAEQFVEKWSKAELSERAASHEHFIDLCRLIDQPTPAQADSTGEDYCFEKHVKVVGSASKGSKGEAGFVDVWKRGYFAWEYKRKDKHKTLDEAYRQLYQYRDDLDNPPLSIVCDIRTTEIRTHFAGYPTARQVIRLEEIPARLEVFRRVFTNPDSFRATLKKTETVTDELAQEFGKLAQELIKRYPPEELHLWETAGSPVAHFLMKVIFCLFAEDIDLLPDQAFTKLINLCLMRPEDFEREATNLFGLMRTGGRFGFDTIPYFNGGLFDEKPALPLKHNDLVMLRRIAGDGQNWAGVAPHIFGTLFERILDPRKRAQIGAHYTSKEDIMLVVEPVVMAPLRREWQALQEKIAPRIEQLKAEKDRKKRDVLASPIAIALDEYRKFLARQRILDPACGSGNFLYIALQQLLDLEDEVVRFAMRHDIALNPVPKVRPTQMHGIEINPYAAELAQVVIWIGYLQWLHIHGISDDKRPILDKLQTIENRDAILDVSKKELPVPAQWPEADFIIGNPPFLGNKLFRQNGLSSEYISALYSAFDLDRNADLCCYWFEQARRQAERSRGNHDIRAGLLATQGIRGESNRKVLERIKEAGDIFNAWSDREWILEGAAVNVSIICFDGGKESDRQLDGRCVQKVNANLTADVDTVSAKRLLENEDVSFIGGMKKGQFDVDWTEARALLAEGGNPNGRTNADVLRPWINGLDITRRPLGMWIIDFATLSAEDASQYEAPFGMVQQRVKPERDKVRTPHERQRWWLHARPVPELRGILTQLSRFIGTARVAKYRLFTFLSPTSLADGQVVVFAKSDDYALGALQSALHEVWALRMGTQLEDRPRYTPSTTFETFPLPWPPGKEDVNHPAYKRIAEAAKTLNEQRERWLNPPEWIEPLARQIDEKDKFEDVPPEARALLRQSAIMAAAARDPRLKKRTEVLPKNWARH